MDNADAIAEVRFYDNMREALRQGNLSEPEQRRQALSLSLTAKNQYETLKEMGTYGGGLADFIEENYQRFTVADRADTRATLNNGQLTETPARMSNEEMEEAWAEYQERNRPQMTDEERYRNEDQRLFSASENLTTRADGYPIADDNETVDVVTIPENAVPDFKTKRELVDFIKNILGNERNIIIKSTGDTILVSNKGLQRAATKARSPEYNEVFGAVRQLLENAKYSGFVEADERHPNVRGQDVYHSGLIIGEKPYSVMFKVDIPKGDSSHNYAGHKISDIRIASADSNGERFTVPTKTEADAIHNISLAVLRGKVNPARRKNGILFSKAETVRGTYDPEKRVIEIFADARPRRSRNC